MAAEVTHQIYFKPMVCKISSAADLETCLINSYAIALKKLIRKFNFAFRFVKFQLRDRLTRGVISFTMTNDVIIANRRSHFMRN